MTDIPVTEEGWPRCYRIVSSRFPPVGIFDQIANPADLEAIFWIEGLTNDRLREEWGDLALVPEEDRVAGPGTSPIMAAFTHLSPSGSRFSDGSFGVYYAGRSRETAIAETVFHAERYLRESHDPPVALTMRVYIGELRPFAFQDIRGFTETRPELYHPDPAHYGPAQAFGLVAKQARAWGILFRSVRHNGGECIAALRPPALGPVRQSSHLAYVWNGSNISDVQVIRSIGVPGRKT